MTRHGLTPEQRALRSCLGAYTSWANTPDPAARTAPARKASLQRFEREVDPDGTLAPVERARRAEAAERAYLTRLALRSTLSRSKAASARRRAVQLDADTQNRSPRDAESLFTVRADRRGRHGQR